MKRHLYPLLRHKNGLKEEGFIIDYFNEISSKLLDCDVIIMFKIFKNGNLIEFKKLRHN